MLLRSFNLGGRAGGPGSSSSSSFEEQGESKVPLPLSSDSTAGPPLGTRSIEKARY